jgi:phosphotransferase system HPr-like phosphotransfer protein
MGLAQYAIVGIEEGQWGVLHDGEIEAQYSTKEAAFESAVAAASLAIRAGHEVHLSVPGQDQRQLA